MILRPCKSQGGDTETLEMLYQRAGFNQEMTDATVAILRRIEEDGSRRRVWGLLSMGSVVLLAENAHHSPRYVQFFASSRKKYTVSCLLPDTYDPWHSLSAATNTEDAAVAMILDAMDLSGGWSPGASESTVEATEIPPPLQEPDSGWLGPLDITELLEGVQFPNPVRSLVGLHGEVTVSQGPPAFVTVYPYYVECWAPPEEAPWPDSIYEGSFRSKEQALILVRSAVAKWPLEVRKPRLRRRIANNVLAVKNI